MRGLLLAILAFAGLGLQTARADETRVAVAANFTEAAKEVAAAFEAATGHRAILSFGSTGQLYAQITQAAPFEVFLAADDVRPDLAVAEGYAVAGSVFTYAVGRLVLWSTEAEVVTGPETLIANEFERLAIANPATAPYGAAGRQVMERLGVLESLTPKLVRGTNIAQTFQFVETGNAELGFVALSQVKGREDGSRWMVDEALHDPILQNAVLLETGRGRPAAEAFLAFLEGPEAAAILMRHGYGIAAR